MRLVIPFLIGAIVCGDATAWAQTTHSGAMRPAVNHDAPIVYIGLFSVHQSGRGHAALTAEKAGDVISGTLSISPCGGGAAGSAKYGVSAFATDVWRMTGKVLEMNDQETVIQLDAKRVRRNGQDESSAPESMTFTLKRGERKTFETFVFPAVGSCDASTSALGAQFASRAEFTGISPTDHARGSITPRSGTVVVGRATQAGETRHAWTPAFSTADLWLIRTRPGRADETLHVTASLLPFPQPFQFDPITIQSPAGTLSVKVEGTIETGRSGDGESRLHFTATRAVTALTTSRPVGESKPAIEGSTKTTVAMPGPDEVLSFEMPPLRTADGVTLPDRLSIRLRLSPK